MSALEKTVIRTTDCMNHHDSATDTYERHTNCMLCRRDLHILDDVLRSFAEE
jgi:hypothetical protein